MEVALHLFGTVTFLIDHLATLVLGIGGGTFNDKNGGDGGSRRRFVLMIVLVIVWQG